VFTVEEREYAVPVASVVEILGYRGATRVPGAPQAVAGIVPVRGRMVTLLNVRLGLGLPPRTRGGREQVIVIDSRGDRLGLVVDAVLRVAPPRAVLALLDLGLLMERLS
jgi:purine-binding chemotaxis protein CheW